MKTYEEWKEGNITARLADNFVKDFSAWMNTPRSCWDNKTPQQLIDCGQEHVLWQMVYYIESGAAS